MKKIIIPLVLAFTSTMANAEYTIHIPLEQNKGGTLPDGSISITSEWVDTSTVYGEWLDQGHPYDCISWFPAASTITVGETFTQTATDCSQDQTRTAQDREVETISGIVRDKAEPYTQSRTITVSSTRDSVGTLETWVATTPTYTDWVNSGEIYGCTNWSPETSTFNQGEAFTQTATDCEQDQTRSRQDREQETTTKAVRNKGTAVTETQTITVSSTRPATGTKVEFEYKAGSTQAVCRYHTQLRFMYSEIYYKGELVFRDVDTSSQACIIRQGFKANGYEVGPSVSGQSWSVKKL